MERVDQDDLVDLREVISGLVAGWRTILLCLVFFIAGGVALLFVVTPKYTVSTVLVSASPERNSLGNSLTSALGQLGGLASLAGATLGSSDAGTEEAFAVFRSRQFNERFIADFNLLPVLFRSQWDAANQRWKPGLRHPPTPAKGAKLFADKIVAISQDRKTSLVSLRIQWRDRLQAVEWSKELIKRLNAEMRSRAITNAEGSVQYLEKELVTTTVVEAREAIGRLMEAQIKQRMLANVTQEYAFRVVDGAMPPDEDDPSWPPPKAALLFAMGLLGLVVGGFVVYITQLFRRPARPIRAQT